MYLHVSTGLIFPYKNFFRVSSRKIFPKKEKRRKGRKIHSSADTLEEKPRILTRFRHDHVARVHRFNRINYGRNVSLKNN